MAGRTDLSSPTAQAALTAERARAAAVDPSQRTYVDNMILAPTPQAAHAAYLAPLQKYTGKAFTDTESLYNYAPMLHSGTIPHGFHLNAQGQLARNSQFKSVDFWGPLAVLGPLAWALGPGAAAGAAGSGGSAAGPLGAYTPGLIGGSGATGTVGAAAGLGTAAGGGGVTGAGGATVAGHSTIGSILGSTAGLNAVNQGVGAVTNYLGTKAAANASTRAAELEAQAAAASLDFLKSQEATRKAEYDAAQAKNYQLYQAQQARLEPYRQFGRGSLAQLMQPIANIPQRNTVGAVMGAR